MVDSQVTFGQYQWLINNEQLVEVMVEVVNNGWLVDNYSCSKNLWQIQMVDYLSWSITNEQLIANTNGLLPVVVVNTKLMNHGCFMLD